MKKIILVIVCFLVIGCSSQKNEDLSDKQNQDNNNTEIVCTPKKFDKTYSYVYETEEECLKQGNDAFLEIIDNVDSKIFTYACQEIVDECGTTWYGVYFNRFNDDHSIYQVYY